MNEQLIKIGLESGMLNYVDNETPRHYFLSGHADEQDLAKFAQLIVQECVDIISPYTVRMSRPGEEYLHPIQEIREHFGVAE